MQLEKVTTRSSEAALVGWISSNDVTLFTTVLVVAIAMFLYARLSKGTRENAQITEKNVTLAQRLNATESERDAADKLLDQTRTKLSLTQEERDQLRKQLLEKLAAISQLNAKLDVLLHEKGDLESQRHSLVEAKESLSKEKSELKSSNASLVERLDSITAQLEAKMAALNDLEKERDRLKKEADELDAIVAGLQQKMKKLNIDLADTRADSTAARTESQAKIEELQTQLAARDKAAAEYLARLKRAAALFEGLKAEKQQLQHALSAAELKRQAELIEEGRNNRELVGLTGKLERVAVLFDASGSMRLAATSGVGDRWAEAQQIAGTWLQHLNVQQCVLVVFSSDIRTFPEDGSLADLRGDGGQAKREALLQHVKDVKPEGGTNTYDALLKAYQYDIDSILLFSDGAPSKSHSGAFDPAVAEQIYALCRAHQNIPIHTVGLGNYFDQNASTFLQSVAKITNGTFRGR
jgi:septal ring factor EnvC (AmiA/AmiB activator)